MGLETGHAIAQVEEVTRATQILPMYSVSIAVWDEVRFFQLQSSIVALFLEKYSSSGT